MPNTYSVNSINKSIIFTITHIKSVSLFLEFLNLNIGKIGRSFILHNIKDMCGEYSTLIIEFESLYEDSWSKNKYNNFSGLYNCLNNKIMCNLLIPQYLLKKKSTSSNGKFEYTFIAAAINDFNFIVTRNINKSFDCIKNETDTKLNHINPINLDKIMSTVRAKLSPYYPKKNIMICNEDELWGY
jgi:hypothetical protein